MANEMMNEDVVADETIVAEEPIAEEAISSIILTPDDLPSLANLQVGDTVSLTIKGVTDNGEYELTEEVAVDPTAEGGKEEVLNALQGV